ncbi:alpha-1B-glycoprotein-like [Emydura macquarii macquarii]|uniref:alpha-1B-glycoprotein-like n=1 Tax=Emydura macquarii macquarii TaxID=1129001 RepID=UPI003529FB93
MELIHLLPLLAALQILPGLVSPAGTLPAPTLSLHPQKQEYFPGDTVGLTCSAPPLEDEVRGFMYYSDVGWAITLLSSSRSSYTYNINIKGPADGGSCECSYWIGQAGSSNKSSRSNTVLMKVTGPPPRPVMSVTPPSGAVSEGLPLIFTCTAPGDAAKRRFHFYRNGTEILPGDVGSQISPREPGTGARNVSVLSIPRAGPNSTGEFTCTYEENVAGRWIVSLGSVAVSVTMTARSRFWLREVALGVSFFTINGLIFLITHLCMKRKGPPEKRKEGPDPTRTNIYSAPFQSATD